MTDVVNVMAAAVDDRPSDGTLVEGFHDGTGDEEEDVEGYSDMGLLGIPAIEVTDGEPVNGANVGILTCIIEG